jgi:hypothetical protein
MELFHFETFRGRNGLGFRVGPCTYVNNYFTFCNFDFQIFGREGKKRENKTCCEL